MRRWKAAPVVFAAAAALAIYSDPTPVRAQNKPVEENITTADGVRLKGLFHKSQKGANTGNAVVILLYPPGAGNTMLKGDWAGIAKQLSDEGFHVFQFDWRGHGKSTNIVDPNLFWNLNGMNPFSGGWNQKYVKGFNKKPIKQALDVKVDIDPRYFPVYVNDLAAVRMHLDQKNDPAGGSQVNTSSIYLIGANEAATLGMLWMSAEWSRPAIHPILPMGLSYKFCPDPRIVADPASGPDVAGAIWLSAARPTSVQEKPIQTWVNAASKLRDNNPMLFMYADKDTKQVKDAKFFYDEVLVSKGNTKIGIQPLQQTFLHEVKGAKVSGVGLLGNNASTGAEDTILKYMAARQKDRVNLVAKNRSYPGPYFINLAHYGLAP